MSAPIEAELSQDGREATCLLCGWRERTNSPEITEFRLARHVREAHRMRLGEIDGRPVPDPWGRDET